MNVVHRHSPHPGGRRVVALPQRALVPGGRGQAAVAGARARAAARAAHQVPLPVRRRAAARLLRALPRLPQAELPPPLRVPRAGHRLVQLPSLLLLFD